MWLRTVALRTGILFIGPLPHTDRNSPVSIRLRPNVTYARHGAESVVITPGTSAIRPQRALTSEQRLELLLTDFVPPTCALPTDVLAVNKFIASCEVLTAVTTVLWDMKACNPEYEHSMFLRNVIK